MRLTRLTFFAIVFGAVMSWFQRFPSAPAERAVIVCTPVRFLIGAAAAISSSMNDSGRIGPARQPWHDDAHRACLRVAERVFLAAAEL